MKILITARQPEEILAKIAAGHVVTAYDKDEPMRRSELLEKIGDKDGLLCTITDKIDDELLERASDLKMIANAAVGYDHIDLDAAGKRGIWVSNTPGVLTDATADLTFALLLASARRIVEGDRVTREGRFRFWAPMNFLGLEVTGKTLGIVGLGLIGKAVAKRARGFDMNVLYHSRNRLPEADEAQLGVRYVGLSDLLADADFVSLHVNLTEQTRHLIGREQLRQMKPTAFLINASRGPVVNEKDLVEALREKRIAGAGLDVYEHEPELTPGLADLHNAVLLPHMGSATHETRAAMARLAAENLLAGLLGKTPPNCLNPHIKRR
ncbi:2-hydroxyacid dehydrogenase [Thermodesulfobacteriota bacterium]